MKINGKLEVPDAAIEAFCRKWKIRELALFGSVLRDDFDADSDIDLLVTFEPNAGTTLFNLMDMEYEMAELLGRRVDIVTRKGVEESQNYIRRKAILSTARPLYVRS